MPTESQQEKTPLSQRIDKALWDFATLVHEHVDVLGGPKWNHCTGCLLGRHILESAIRDRIDEARNEPRPEPGHETLESIIARAWPKDAPITKLREIAMALMDMVLEGNPRRYEVQLGRWLESELDKLEAPQPTRAADIAGAAEPKPQHIFERHHVGEGDLADRRGIPLPRTSKHSSYAQLPLEPFLARFPEIQRIGTPVPEGEKPSMTIITALQFKALAETVDLLIAERNAKL